MSNEEVFSSYASRCCAGVGRVEDLKDWSQCPYQAKVVTFAMMDAVAYALPLCEGHSKRLDKSGG